MGKLVHAAIMAGINNDLGSGGSVDLMVIDKEGNHPLRNYDRPNERKYRKEGGYKFPRGTAKVLSKEFRPLSSLVSIETTQVPSAMQVGESGGLCGVVGNECWGKTTREGREQRSRYVRAHA